MSRRTGGEKAERAGKGGHGDHTDRPHDHALCGIAERGFADDAVVGGAAQSAREIAAGRKSHGLGHDQPDGCGDGQTRGRGAGAVGRSERQSDPRTQRDDDEGNRCGNAPAMAALQENGVRPASDAAGTITSRSIIAVSVIR
jgi:hypothetical protein